MHTGNFAGMGELFVNGKSVGKVDMWIYPPGGEGIFGVGE